MKKKKKKELTSIEIMKKIRKTWTINPRTRVSEDKGYNRNKEKEKTRKQEDY